MLFMDSPNIRSNSYLCSPQPPRVAVCLTMENIPLFKIIMKVVTSWCDKSMNSFEKYLRQWSTEPALVAVIQIITKQNITTF